MFGGRMGTTSNCREGSQLAVDNAGSQRHRAVTDPLGRRGPRIARDIEKMARKRQQQAATSF
jgi:hypothetical protein